MAPSTAAGVFTAVASLITAFTLLIGALPLLIKTLVDLRRTKDAVAQVHVIVNQQRTDMQRYTRALVAALEKAGIDVPADQSVEPAPPTPTKTS